MAESDLLNRFSQALALAHQRPLTTTDAKKVYNGIVTEFAEANHAQRAFILRMLDFTRIRST